MDMLIDGPPHCSAFIWRIGAVRPGRGESGQPARAEDQPEQLDAESQKQGVRRVRRGPRLCSQGDAPSGLRPAGYRHWVRGVPGTYASVQQAGSLEGAEADLVAGPMGAQENGRRLGRGGLRDRVECRGGSV